MDTLDDVLADPDSDAAREAHAAAIAGTDAARAELIRVQCGLAQLEPTSERVRALRRREMALVEKHQARWMKALKPSVVWGWLRRGFFEEVRVNGKRFVDSDAAVFEREPIRALWSRDVGNKLVGSFGALPALRRLRRLSLPECKLDAKGLTGLLASPHLSGLRELALARNSLRGVALAEALLGWTGLATLEHLDLGSNPRLDADALAALLSSDTPRVLATLKLDGVVVGLDGAIALARHLALPALRSLSLAGCRLEGEDVRELRACTALAHLDTLDLGGNPLDGLGMHAIRAGTWAGTLSRLRVSQAQDASCQLGVLCEAGALPRLAHLAYASPRLDRTAIDSLASRSWPLRSLTLEGPIDAEGLSALAASPLRGTIESLRLGAYAHPCAPLAETLLRHAWPRLHTLRFDGAPVPHAAAMGLIDAPSLPVLSALSIPIDDARATLSLPHAPM